MKSTLLGAKHIVSTCMAIRKGENVLIVTDPLRMKIGEVISNAARAVGAKTTLICMPVGIRHGDEPPKFVATVMRSFDAVILPTTFSLTHTQARRRASEAGARIATMPMITERMMRSGGMLADYRKVMRLTRKVAHEINDASLVEVTTRAGTDLRFSVSGRMAHPDTGLFHKPGDWGNLPAGEAFVAPLEGTGEGNVVVDGSMVDNFMGEIDISFKKGRAVEILGGPAKRLLKILKAAGRRAGNLAEFGVGANPWARLIGNVLEDEKVLGTCHIALGDNSTFGGHVRAGVHVDGIFKRPTVTLDKKVLMEEGRLKV